MNRAALDAYIGRVFGCPAEYMWEKYPQFAVYRRKESGKWFAVIMDIPQAKLGLPADGYICIVNLKCEPALIASLIDHKRYFPAYHMNKNHWLSVALNGSVDEDALKFLLHSSYDAVDKKHK